MRIQNIENELSRGVKNNKFPWILPTGLVINQQFFDKKTLKVKPFIDTFNNQFVRTFRSIIKIITNLLNR